MSAKIAPQRRAAPPRLTLRSAGPTMFGNLGRRSTQDGQSASSPTAVANSGPGQPRNTAFGELVSDSPQTSIDMEAMTHVKRKARTARLLHLKARYNVPRINIIHDAHRTTKYVIPWNSRFRRYWDLLAVCFVLYLSYKIPVGVAFGDGWAFPKWMETLMDVFFIADIVLNFRTGFIHNGHHITDPAQIREHYMQTWLWIDVVASIPFERILAGMMDKSARKSLKMLKWLKFPKLLRFGKFLRYLRSNIKYYQLFLLTCGMLFSVHLLGCLWASVSSPCFDPVSEDEFVEGGSGYVVCSDEQMTWIYFSSIYTALLMIFNVQDGTRFLAWASESSSEPGSNNSSRGTGASNGTATGLPFATVPDWVAAGSADHFVSALGVYAVSALAVVVGFALVIQIIAEVGVFASYRSVELRNFHHKVGLFKTEMSNANLADDLQYKVTRYYDYLWMNNKAGLASRTSGLLQDPDLSMTLKKEVALAMHGSVISSVTIFDGCSEDCIFDIAMRLRNHIYLPGDRVFGKGDAANELFIVRDGVIRLQVPAALVHAAKHGLSVEGENTPAGQSGVDGNEEDEEKYVGRGSFFGELALLTSMPRACSAFSHSVTELSELCKKDFHEVMTRYPELNQEVIEEVSLAYPHLAAEISLYSPKRKRRPAKKPLGSAALSAPAPRSLDGGAGALPMGATGGTTPAATMEALPALHAPASPTVQARRDAEMDMLATRIERFLGKRIDDGLAAIEDKAMRRIEEALARR